MIVVNRLGSLSNTMSETDLSQNTAPSLVGRLLFSGGLSVLAIRNLTNLDGRIAYAEAKGVPSADTLVPAASALLLGGSLGVGTWKFPKLSAGSIAAFFVGVTPLMHNFWAVDEDARGEELTSFLQNLALLGAAVAFIRHAREE